MQVLTAVGEGESILTALQEAVPEDVRGNMAAAVSGAVQARGLSFNLVGFGKGMPPPRLPAGLIENIKGKISGGKKKESTSPTPPLPVDGPASEGIKDTNSQPTSSDQSESRKADNQGEDILSCTSTLLGQMMAFLFQFRTWLCYLSGSEWHFHARLSECNRSYHQLCSYSLLSNESIYV